MLQTSTSLTVDIIDENDEVPTFTSPEYYREIPENGGRNLTIITLSATDR